MRLLTAFCAWLAHVWALASRPVSDEDYEEHLQDLPPC